MKKLLILLCMGLMLSCHNVQRSDVESVNSRIKNVSIAYDVNFTYEIIEVDGVEYLTSSRGGIYPLVKTPIKVDTIYVDSVVTKVFIDTVAISKIH